MRTETRPARAEDIQRIYGRTAGQTVRAQVWTVDGDPVAIVGYYMAGQTAVVFSDIKVDAPKVSIWRAAKAYMANMKVPATCFACDGSGPFLERLGWSHVGPTEDGELYKWQV